MQNDITVQELKERLDKGEKINLIDVRETWEYEEANMDGKLIPLGELAGSLDQIDNWKDQEVVVHCRSGQRSDAACDFMRKQGFQNVRNLRGGILAWNALTSSEGQ